MESSTFKDPMPFFQRLLLCSAFLRLMINEPSLISLVISCLQFRTMD